MKFLCCLLLLFLSVSCADDKQGDAFGKNQLKGQAQGGFSDLIVVAENEFWDKGLQSDVAFVFADEMKGLFRSEVNFDVIHLRPQGFSDLFKKQRLVLFFDVTAANKKIGIGFQENKFAKGQLYIKVSARDMDEASLLLIGAKEALLEKVQKHRIKGIQKKVGKMQNLRVKELLSKAMGVELVLTESYHTTIQKNDFIYFAKRGKTLCESGVSSKCAYQLGLFVSRRSYQREEIFQKDNFVLWRDSLTKKYIIGPEKEQATYMECESTLPIKTKILSIDGHYCVEYRGWWNMVNATMGGPFISWVIVDEKNSQLYLIDGFVFAPNFGKKKFLNELEGMAKTFKVL